MKHCHFLICLFAAVIMLGCSEKQAPEKAEGTKTPADPPKKVSAANPGKEPDKTSAATTDKSPEPAPQKSPEAPAPSPEASKAPDAELSDALIPVAIVDGAATIGPDNSMIQFVGKHVPPREPDPRTGGFAEFSGKVAVDAAAKSVSSVTVEINPDSLFSFNPMLTAHLKNQDFLDVNEYPQAKFESTAIAAVDAAAGTYTIVGNFTLHGVTKEITLPATIKFTEAGLTLTSEFMILRSEFGIDSTAAKGTEDVVEMSVVIGKKTEAK